jgi:hypothetical protein
MHSAGEPPGDVVNFRIEVLRVKSAQPAHGLHSFTHCAPSLDIMQETMKIVQMSPYWPLEGNSYRILTENGKELYRWSNEQA